MIVGAIVGAVTGLILATVFALFAKGKPCPQCDRPLPVPWFTPLRECPRCGCELDEPAKPAAASTREGDWRPLAPRAPRPRDPPGAGRAGVGRFVLAGGAGEPAGVVVPAGPGGGPAPRDPRPRGPTRP